MTRSDRIVVQAALLVFAVVAIRARAEAATLFSPATTNPQSVSDLECLVTNVSSKALTIQVQLIKFDGTAVLADSTPQTIAAGASINSGTVSDAIAYCKVTVKGSKNSVRGAIIVRDLGPHDGVIFIQLPVT